MNGAFVGALCFIEIDDEVAESSLRAVTLARALAESVEGELVAACVGVASPSVVTTLGTFGVTRLYQIALGGLDAYSPTMWARALSECTAQLGARCVVAAGTDRGHEVLAFAGAARTMPVVANCVSAEWASDSLLRLTRQRWGGSLLEELEWNVQVDAPSALLSVATDGVAATAAPRPVTCEVVVVAHEVSERDGDVRVAEWRPRAGGVALADARVVVGGGRGVGSEENFAQLDELAALLAGTVGVSRAVTSAGWRPHAQQVGQTGTRINPDLYLACGISGATQHLAGCRSAKHVVAVNVDADAPMIARADYAVVSDLHVFIPALIGAIRARLSRTS